MRPTMRVDRTVLKVNQAFIVALQFIAFLLGMNLGGQWLTGAVAAAMTLGTAKPAYGPFRLA